MLNRLLFLVTVALSLALAAFVLLAPSLHGSTPAADHGNRLMALFARDAAVRRTALASSAGLLATAFVFFRARKPRPSSS